MDRFTLKSWAVGFEVPFFDVDNNVGYEELISELSSKYRNWFDVLKTELSIVELPNTNSVILYTFVIRVDSDLVNSDTFESEWSQVQSEVTDVLRGWIEKQKLEYQIINCI